MKYLLNKKALLLVAILVSAVVSYFSAAFNPYWFRVIILSGIYATMAVSLNLINGYTGQFSLGHAGFMAVGAYAAAWFSKEKGLAVLHALGEHNVLAPNVLFVLSLALGGLLAAFAGLLVGVPSLRLKGDYLAIVTLGFGEIIRVLIQNAEFVGANRGYGDIPAYTTFLWVYGVLALTIYMVVSLIDSTYGRGFLTVRDDEIAAEAMGINTTRYKVVAFVFGAFIAGVAGGLYAHFLRYVNADGFDFQLSIQIVIMVILGGMGSTGGVTFAAVLLTVLLEYLREVPKYAFLPEPVRRLAENRTILFALILITLMLLRPQGLFGGIRAFGGKTTRKLPRAA